MKAPLPKPQPKSENAKTIHSRMLETAQVAEKPYHATLMGQMG